MHSDAHPSHCVHRVRSNAGGDHVPFRLHASAWGSQCPGPRMPRRREKRAYAPRYVREPLYGLHVQVKDACHRNGLSSCFARSTCSDRRTLAPRPRAQLPREVGVRPGRQPLQLARVPRLRQKTRQRPRFPTCEYISPRCASAPRVDLPCVAPRSLRTVTSRRSAAAQPAAHTRMSMASPVRDGRGRTSLARLAAPHARPLRAHAAPCRRCRAHGLRAPIADAVALPEPA